MEKIEQAIQDIYADDVAMCYGCGRLNESGHHFRTGWDGENTVTFFTPKPEHTAIPGFVYGGMLASLIDCHGTGSASLFLHKKNGHVIGDGAEPPRFVTASLKVDFLKPTPHGIPLKAVGMVTEIHPKKFKVETNVYADEDIVASGEVIAVVMPKSFGSKED
ncbi:PaaI family thioesterase [Robertmurraya andreesenii]|uniref:Acyl-coenzyme A thioesterase PaaI-like protein n=1 Tax=Anoxybacillus andreesenii TaxID=1325932 RepID=A0ABT9V1P2_9BACL|nr:PaaI family thioesterase [Robertmurraya andreesenii]MDQ0154868.1 acyl-coenzyme A thioesterase PaaI-like protein [Robertmurraya andreesenii]